MATLGTTTEPTTGQTYFGLNSTNHHAVLLTMPAGGPWEITRLGAWLAGMGASAQVKLCIWSAGGTLLASSATFTAASMAFALGNNVNYEQNVGPIEVNGGVQVFVGFARDPSDPVQFGTRSGTRYDKYSASWPSSMVGNSSVSGGACGAYIDNYQSANTAPNAPVSLTPTGNAVVNSGTAPTLSGTRSDPDGDNLNAFQVIVYADDGVTNLFDSTLNGTGTGFARTVSLPAAHAYYKWKARTRDSGNLWGPYSALQRFYANAVPATPGAPTVETDNLTPSIGGAFSDSGDTLAAVQIEVGLNASPYTSKWASGDLAKSGTSWSATYAGSALSYGVAYRARYRVKDSHGAYSSWSAYKTFTLVQPTGPSNDTPRTTSPRLSSLTPTLTVGHSANFRNDQIEVRSADAGGGSLLWSKAKDGVDYANTTSKARVYAGTALAYGGRYWWRALIELSDGTDSAWSAWHPIRINAEPTSPTAMTPTGGTVTSDTTPELRMRFADPDTDQGDAASLVTLEVRNNATDALVYSQTGVAPTPGVGSDGQSYDHKVSTSALTNDVTYKWRARFTDTMGRQGPFSAYQVFKVSQPPSATGTSPTGGATVVESTPTLDWGFTGSGGKTQYSFQVHVYDKGPTGANYADEVMVHDSGERVSSATAYDLPYGVLVDGHDYRWDVVVKDTDMLTYTLT